MDIEAIVQKFAGGLLGVTYRSAENVLRAALTEADSCMAMEHNLKMLQVESAHAIELRAYEATVQNLEQRIRELEAQRVPEGFVMVPVEPTQKILGEMRKKHWEIRGCQLCDDDYRDIFAAMLSAAPKKEDGE